MAKDTLEDQQKKVIDNLLDTHKRYVNANFNLCEFQLDESLNFLNRERHRSTIELLVNMLKASDIPKSNYEHFVEELIRLSGHYLNANAELSKIANRRYKEWNSQKKS